MNMVFSHYKLSFTIMQNEANERNSLRVLKESRSSDRVLLELVLWEAFLIQRHLEVAVLLPKEALQV